MDRSGFWSLWIAVAAIAFGVGRLLGVSIEEPYANAGVVAPPSRVAGVAPPAAVPQEEKTDEVAKAAPVAEPIVEKAPPVKKSIAEDLAQLRKDNLPTEPGVKADGPPVKDAKLIALSKAPKGHLPPPALGSDDPLVTVLVIADFQCPVCRRVVLPVQQAVRELGKDVRFEFRQHALESHALAEDAAMATMAAHKQGRFWEYHDLIFSNFGQLTQFDLEDYATTLELDLERFKKDMKDEKLREQVRAEGRTADLLGARGTPAFFVNGKKHVGWGSYFGFKGMITRELNKVKPLAGKGKSRLDIYKQRIRENSDKPKDYIRYFLEGRIPPEKVAAD